MRLLIAIAIVVAFAMLFVGSRMPFPGPGGPAQSPPPPGAMPQVGVLYRVTPYRAEPIVLGATSWSFDEPVNWPPQEPSDVISMPYAVPGVLKLISEDKAVFRADVDGSFLALTKVAAIAILGTGCL
jgi:hypothetical protein